MSILKIGISVIDNKNIKMIYGKKSLTSETEIFVREEDFEIPHGLDYKLAIEELEKIQHSTKD